ncbi:hypothetical protein [Carboxylicivirga taeanensis]|uniref:hypothetical protein n=1 Tax=Carboxylicivirga taeanensis TaxID=1416875 RepID=UPI003F6E0505
MKKLSYQRPFPRGKYPVYTFVLMIVLGCAGSGFAQTDSTYYRVSKQEESNFRRQVYLLEAMLSLMTHPLIEPLSADGWKELNGHYQPGITIELKSGLTWHTDSTAPPKPFLFIPRVYTKKGLTKPEIAERLQYQQVLKELDNKKNIKQIIIDDIATDSINMKRYRTRFIYEYDPSLKLVLKEKLKTIDSEH